MIGEHAVPGCGLALVQVDDAALEDARAKVAKRYMFGDEGQFTAHRRSAPVQDTSSGDEDFEEGSYEARLRA